MGFIRVGEGAPRDEGESQQHRGGVCSGKGESDDVSEEMRVGRGRYWLGRKPVLR